MPVDLSILIPTHNAQASVPEVVLALGRVLADLPGEVEVVLVDDGSTDLTLARARALLTGRPWLRLLRLDEHLGESAAISAGLRAARGAWIALFSADLQYDPHDLAAIWTRARRGEADWFQGRRTNPGEVGLGGRVIRSFERGLLGARGLDPTCALRVFRRDIAVRLPLQYRGLLRFLPVYAARLGYAVAEHDVAWRRPPASHDPGDALERFADELLDLLAVRWMLARALDATGVELKLPASITEAGKVREEISVPFPRATASLPPR
jgi:dolichol-phosphate mannosyltransferase